MIFLSGPPSSPTMLTTYPKLFITLTWNQPPGDVVDSYNISYSFIIGGCGVGGGNIMSTVNGSSREYTLTGLEENSDFTIFITAMNGAGSSPPANTTARTPIAGKIIMATSIIIHTDYNITAPSSPPKSLNVSSTSPTSISITWGDVPCRERNVDMITGYSVTYFCIDHSHPCGNQTVQVLGEDNKTFTASQLIPRTNYTFEVMAFHDNQSTSLQSPANVTGSTEIPEGT